MTRTDPVVFLKRIGYARTLCTLAVEYIPKILVIFSKKSTSTTIVQH